MLVMVKLAAKAIYSIFTFPWRCIMNMRGNGKPSTIYTYEDEFGSVEILPLEKLEYLKFQFSGISEYALNHREDSGLEYVDIYPVPDPPIELADLQIRCDELVSPFQNIASKCKVYYSDYGGGCASTYCYALSENVVVFWDCDKDAIVSTIWLRMDMCFEKDKEDTLLLFETLAKIRPLLIANYAYTEPVALDDTEGLKAMVDEFYHRFNPSLCTPGTQSLLLTDSNGCMKYMWHDASDRQPID